MAMPIGDGTLSPKFYREIDLRLIYQQFMANGSKHNWEFVVRSVPHLPDILIAELKRDA